MAENEPPALPSGADEPTPPRGLDAAEYRRFQEFQRFQDYQRFVRQQGGGPPTNLPVPVQPGTVHEPHPVEAQLAGMQQQLARIERVTNPPLWQKILRNKWLHRAVWLVIIVVLATWGLPKLINHYFGGGTDQNPAAPGNLPLPKNQSRELAQHQDDAVTDVYLFIALKQPEHACFYFVGAAGQEFANAVGASTCTAAVQKLERQVTDPGTYQAPILTAQRDLTSPTMAIRSCDFEIGGGPLLGNFVVTQQPDQTWGITSYSKGPSTCPATTIPAPPT
ncbi:MAG TPA: hypothetical protein VFX16_35610 [Pseudonocardiaceae bacterium]|nr:hypothetical protein [Pseudonocardiaceae bacterium]